MNIQKLLLIPILIIGIGFIIGGIAGIRYTDKVIDEYKPTTAKIEEIRKTRKKIGGRSKKSTSYKVTVSYHVEGKFYKETLNSYNASMKEGKIIPVYYHPENPSKVVSVSSNDVIYTILIAVGSILLLFNWLVMPKLLEIAFRNQS